MNNPKISVVMPNYNCEAFLPEAIESILNQTFENFEFIIIDDGSTDNSWEIIKKYSQEDSRIIALRNEKNLRICETLNRGIKISKGKYIARMDSDDIALHDWLSTQFQFMEDSNNLKIGVCGANFFIINAKGEIVGKKTFPETNQQCREAFWFRNPFGHNTVLIRKECFNEFGFYDENFIYAEDLELWMRFGQKYELHNSQAYLLKYRIFGGNSMLTRQKQMVKSTLKARKKAGCDYGYKISIKGRIFFFLTWLVQFLPPTFVFYVFNFFKK